MTFCLLLNVSWNANLISYLATTNIQFPFDRLETLLRETDFKIGILPGSAHMDNFALSTKPNYVKAWKERIEPFLDEYKPYQGNLIFLIILFNKIEFHNIEYIYSSETDAMDSYRKSFNCPILHFSRN